MTRRLKSRLHDWVILNYDRVLDRVTREVCRDDVPIDKSTEAAEIAVQEFLCRLLKGETSLSRRLVVGADDGLWVQPPRGRRRRRKSQPFRIAYAVKCCGRLARALLVKEAKMTRMDQQ